MCIPSSACLLLLAVPAHSKLSLLLVGARGACARPPTLPRPNCIARLAILDSFLRFAQAWQSRLTSTRRGLTHARRRPRRARTARVPLVCLTTCDVGSGRREGYACKRGGRVRRALRCGRQRPWPKSTEKLWVVTLWLARARRTHTPFRTQADQAVDASHTTARPPRTRAAVFETAKQRDHLWMRAPGGVRRARRRRQGPLLALVQLQRWPQACAETCPVRPGGWCMPASRWPP